MAKEEKVSLTISINKEYRDRLRMIAAEQTFSNPDKVTSASTLAKEIICKYLDKLTSEVDAR